ncbi:MAG TPA: hypothetical protein VGP37_07915, partial [Candidatus Nanopelagicales bacterium]|nr:hypothetical protein [Candidatus Nanopelagicales bacterium]
ATGPVIVVVASNPVASTNPRTRRRISGSTGHHGRDDDCSDGYCQYKQGDQPPGARIHNGQRRRAAHEHRMNNH